MNLVLTYSCAAIATGIGTATYRPLSVARAKPVRRHIIISSNSNSNSPNLIANYSSKCSSGGALQLQTQLQTARPWPAETSRTVVELCCEGTICTLTESGWPFCDSINFTVDDLGMPVLFLHPSSIHSNHFLHHSRCSLHVQLDQPGCRKLQCTLMGNIWKPEDSKGKERLQSIWRKQFVGEVDQESLYAIAVENVLQSQGVGQEGFWIGAAEYREASADPLRNYAPKLIKDMNDKHWEDIQRICKIYVDLDVQVEETKMVWIDKLGFDLHLTTRSRHEALEVRIPFPREVKDEKDAKSSLTLMAQLAWEVEKNLVVPNFERVKFIQKLTR